MSKKSVLVVASLAYDGIETPKNKVDYVLGGAGTYICLSLKNFSSEYSIVSVVGNDFKTEDLNLLETLNNLNINDYKTLEKFYGEKYKKN